MLSPYRWYKNRKSWWKDRKDSPVHSKQLKNIKLNVLTALERPYAEEYRPRLEGKIPATNDNRPILLACCDEGYFYKFARQLAISSVLQDKQTRIHLHIYAPGPLCIADAEFLQERLGSQLTISTEAGDRNPYKTNSAYFYAAGRFAVAAEIGAICKVPIMVIDVDGFVRGSMAGEFGKLGSCDVGLIRRPRKLKPWRRVLACAVFVNPSPAGLKFIKDLSSAVHLSLQSLPDYHVDQTALHYLLEEYTRKNIKIEIAELSITWGDHDFSQESVIWSAKGERKGQFAGLSLQQARDVVLNHK